MTKRKVRENARKVSDLKESLYSELVGEGDPAIRVFLKCQIESLSAVGYMMLDQEERMPDD